MAGHKTARCALLAAGALAAVPVCSPAAVIYSGIRNLSVTSSNPGNFDQKIEVDVDLDGNNLLDVGVFLGSKLAFVSGSSAVMVDNSGFYAQRIGSGQVIGSNANWKSLGVLAGVGSNPVPIEGPWAPPNQTGTFGFAFLDSSSAVYYGWARANVDFDLQAGTSTATLIDWAYENRRDASIQTAVPEPSTLSLLALGAAGLAAVRARRNKA